LSGFDLQQRFSIRANFNWNKALTQDRDAATKAKPKDTRNETAAV
jgi:hypothetical protein